MKFSIKCTATIFLSTLLPVLGTAAELEYEVRIGASRSDNIARTDDLEIEETAALAGLVLDVQHESPKVEASLVTDMEYRSYTDDTFDNEVTGSLNADLLVKFAPDVFSWVFQDQFGNLQTNPFQPDTAVNRENINRFATGPDLRIQMGSSTAFELGGRLYINQFEVSDIDNDVLNGRISFVRATSPNRSVSLNVTADRIEYDDTVLNSNYDRQSAYFGFESENSRGSLTVNLGYNELHDNGIVTDGNVILFNLDREISPSMTINLSYDESLTDASDTLGRSQNPGQEFSDPQQTAGVSDSFENRRFTMGVDHNRNNNNFFVTLLYNEDEYVTVSTLDRDSLGVRIGFSRLLGSSWRIRLSGAFQRTDFLETGREDDDTVLSAGISKQLSRSVGINLDFTRFDRDSSEPGFDYVENLVNLTFSYGR